MAQTQVRRQNMVLAIGIALFVVVVIVVAVLGLLRFRPGLPDRLSIATAGRNGYYHAVGRELARHLKSRRKVKLEVVTSSGSLDNLKLLESRKVTFGLYQGGSAAKRSGAVRSVGAVGFEYLHVVVPSSSPLRKMSHASALLRGKAVQVGPLGSGTETVARLVLAHHGLRYKDIKATHLGWSKVVPAMRSGKLAAAFFVSGFRSDTIRDLLSKGHRLVEVDHSRGLRYADLAFHPAHIPAGIYGDGGNLPGFGPKGIETVAVKTVLVTHKDTPVAAVKALLACLVADTFARSLRLPELNERFAGKVLDFPLHGAAAMWYQRNKPVSADRFEIFSAILGAILVLVSMGSWVRGRLDDRRRQVLVDRLDSFVATLIEIEERSLEIQDPEELRALLTEVTLSKVEAARLYMDDQVDGAAYQTYVSQAQMLSQKLLSRTQIELTTRHLART